MPQVIDLFAGVGGISLGAARAGFDVALAVELDDHAITAHRRNFPGSTHLQNDVSCLTGAALLRHAGVQAGDLDGLVGGPPCQGFSVMGRKAADDPRNNLFIKFFELVSECQPNFFLAENVPGILDAQHDEMRHAARAQIERDYVSLPPMRLRATDYGAPTIRERVFFIGYRADAGMRVTNEDFIAARVATPITVGEALRGLPSNISSGWLTEEQSWNVVREVPESAFWTRMAGAIPEGVGNAEAIRLYREEGRVSGCFGTRHTLAVRRRYRRLRPGEQDTTSKAVRLNPVGFCPTLRAGTDVTRGSYQAVRPIHPTAARVITPREAARLQGFPDWFQFAPTKWHSFRQIGNSVSPLVSEAVFTVIATALLQRQVGQ